MPVAAVANPMSWNLITTQQQESINRMCSAHVGIPYASDTFTDDEWNKFTLCREAMADGLVHTRPMIPRPYPINLPHR